MNYCNPNSLVAQENIDIQTGAAAGLEQAIDRFTWLKHFVSNDHLTEIRALEVKTGEGRNSGTSSGFFDATNYSEAISSAAKLSGSAKGVYFTLNPVSHSAGLSAKDTDIVERRWLLVDCDPERGIAGDCSSTEAEKAQAFDKVHEIRKVLAEDFDWPQPILADSGNGYHLLYRVQLPTEDGGVVKNVLAALANRFNSETVKIDTKVGNASRICRLYGTMACKGESTEDRPHRESKVIDIPAELTPVTREQLEEVETMFRPTSQQKHEVTQLSVLPGTTDPATAEVLARARAYLTKLPPAVSGKGGHDQTFSAACRLVLDFNLRPEEAFPILAEWNQTCQPPWSDGELRHKLEDADKKEGPRGTLLGELDTRQVDGSENSSIRGIVCSDHPDDPHRLAGLFHESGYGGSEGDRLRFWKGQWFVWQKGCYRKMSAVDLNAQLARDLPALVPTPTSSSKGVKITAKLKGDVMSALQGLCLVSSDYSQPSWLGDVADSPGEPCNTIAFANCLLSLNQDGSIARSYPTSPNWFSPVCLPYAFDPEATAPKWEAFLAKNLEGDLERINILQEWFGYCLTFDSSFQKMLLLEGEGCNGKSVATAVLSAMLGSTNVSNLPLERFGDKFSLSQTIGRLANVANEIGDIDKVAEGYLKDLATGASMTFEEKYASPYTAKATARLVFAFNNRPRFQDRTNGIWRRILLIPFRVQIQEKEKVLGMDQPEWWTKHGELPGILNWALQGLARLRKQREFSRSTVCEETLVEYRTDCNPAQSFLEQNCEVAQDMMWVERAELRCRYNEWCNLYGYRALNDVKFGVELRRVFPNVSDGKDKRGHSGKRFNSYRGIKYTGPVSFKV